MEPISDTDRSYNASTEQGEERLDEESRVRAGKSQGRQNDEKKTQRNPVIRWPVTREAAKPSRLHRKLGSDSKPDVFELKTRSGVWFARRRGKKT